MEILLLIILVLVNIGLVYAYIKQQRLNRLLLHIFHSSEEKEYVLDHIYFQDVLKLKKDMNKMINADIDISKLELALKKQRSKEHLN